MIACGAIYLAGRVLQRALPEDPPWWTLFDTKTEGLSGSFGASTEAFCFALLTDILVVFFPDLVQVCNTLAWLYSRPKPKEIQLELIKVTQPYQP